MSIPTLLLNDGHRIPQLGFGVWQITGRQIVATVATALDAGYRHIDTASAYGNETGVGQAIRESGIARDDLFITTKLANGTHGRARQELEASLDRLDLDHVDLYLIHWPMPGAGKRVEAWEAMQQAQQDGLVRSIGVSNFTPKYLDEIIALGGIVPAVNQIELHPTYQQRDVQTADTDRSIVTEAYSPLGLGADLRNRAIVSIAERIGRTPAQVVLRWHMQAGRIAIPKSVTPDRIRENVVVADFELTAADIAAIDALETGNLIGWDPETVRS